MIEMVMVLASIIILAGMLFPMFKTLRDQGKKAKCLSNLKQLGAAIQLYTQDDAFGRYPGWTGGCAMVKNLPALLYGYMGQEGTAVLQSGELMLFRCPKNTWTANLGERTDAWGNRVDYAMNCNLTGEQALLKVGNHTIAAVLYDQPVYPPDASDQVHSGGSNFLFADGHTAWVRRDRIQASWPEADPHGGSQYDDWGLL